jgi:hypothetical protein
MFCSTYRVVCGRHYSSIESNPKPIPATWQLEGIIGQCSSNLMNILTICRPAFSGKVSPHFVIATVTTAQKQDL